MFRCTFPVYFKPFARVWHRVKAMFKIPGNNNSTYLWLTGMVLFLVGCDSASVSAQSTRPSDPAENLPVKTVQSDQDLQPVIPSDPLIVKNVCKKILTDDFKGARSYLDDYKGTLGSALEQLDYILDEYEQLKADRKKTKQVEYDKRLAEFEETEGEAFPEDANDISEAFAAVSQVYQLSDKEQKDEILQQEYVTRLVEKALELGAEFETQGKWVDAYAHCYYWLAALYKDNKEYKHLNEELLDKAVIEASLKDNKCDTAIERLQGIRPEMVVNALAVLDVHYISIIDYGEMGKKGVKRCKLIGDVLAYSQEELPFKVTPEQAAVWKAALISLEDEMESTDLKVVTKDKYIWAFNQLLELNGSILEIPQEVVISQFAEASLEALDPVTNLVWPWMVKDFQKSMTQNFTGIGIHIQETRDGVLKVASLLPDTPAYNSGLDAEDQILFVDGESTEDMPISCVIDKITGPEGTNVVLTVHHKDAPAGVNEDIKITRARIIVPTIKGWQRIDDGKWQFMLDTVNRLGYIRITNFTESTASGMEEALKELNAQGVQGLILDLRNNTGGYLNTAADVVDMFVDHGLIVKSQPRWALPSYEIAHKKGTYSDYPLVILVNGVTASASEIVSGALKDPKYSRATIVGTRTYGKGSVQTITDQSGFGSQLKYTMAYYYLPSGQPVKTRYVLEKEDRTDWGIEPDIEVELPNFEAAEMYDVQFANEILSKIDHDNGDEQEKRYNAHEVIKADPQLAAGLLVLKTKVIAAGGQIRPFVDTIAKADVAENVEE